MSAQPQVEVTPTVRAWLPMVPDHIALVGGGTVAAAGLPEKEARAIGAAWTEALVAKGRAK